MRKIILYIAISLDGKIADQDGNFEWLEEVPNPDKNDYCYNELFKKIDTTIMGNATYEQVMDFPDFPYKEKKNYVVTRNQNLKADDYAEYVSFDHIAFFKNLKQQEGKDIWLIGGGEVNTLLDQSNLIDEYMVFIMPIIVGQGIPLFAPHRSMRPLSLIHSHTYASGVTLLHYKS